VSIETFARDAIGLLACGLCALVTTAWLWLLVGP
jgi:hypothetical protein